MEFNSAVRGRGWNPTAQKMIESMYAEAGYKTPKVVYWNIQSRGDNNKPVQFDKIMDMTKDYYRMRTYANLIMPFAPRFDTPYQYYLDKSREYKRIYGLDADAKFLNDYPEYFSFSASL